MPRENRLSGHLAGRGHGLTAADLNSMNKPRIDRAAAPRAVPAATCPMHHLVEKFQ